MKKNIVVLFGGKSVEHDISVITAMQTINNLDKQKYTIYPVFIDKQGGWFFSEKFFDIKGIINFDPNSKAACKVCMLCGDNSLYFVVKNKLKKQATIDCIICATHGGLGENGALQGFLELVGVPYTGCDVLSSAICMNKLITKQLLKNNNIDVCKYDCFSSYQITNNISEVISNIDKAFDYPIVTKPCSQGSSIGISYVSNKSQLKKALQLAAEFDQTVLVEEAVQNLEEINVSVFEVDGKVETSVLEKPKTQKHFLDFDEKYLKNASSKKSGMSSLARELPAKLDVNTKNKIIEMATKTYKVCHCSSVVRIDFLINKKTNQVYVNEVNTIPGSLSFYLWQYDRYKFNKLLDKLLQQAIDVFKNKNSKSVVYNTKVLENFSINMAGNKLK